MQKKKNLVTLEPSVLNRMRECPVFPRAFQNLPGFPCGLLEGFVAMQGFKNWTGSLKRGAFKIACFPVNWNLIVTLSDLRMLAYLITEEVVSPLWPSYHASYVSVYNWPSSLNDEEVTFWGWWNLFLDPFCWGLICVAPKFICLNPSTPECDFIWRESL